MHAWLSTQSRLATFLSSLIARRWVGYQSLLRFRLGDLSVDEMVGPGALTVVRPTGVYLLDFFCIGVQFYLLLGPCLCFVSFLYLDLCVLGDGALISWGSFMQTKHLCALIHI